jgi:polyphosphate kinase 2 (PPK2 family)
MIQIFNRSHYEDILVPSVDKYIDAKTIQKRYAHINNFEQLLADNDTHVVKIYLHTSKEEQKRRLEERLHLPHKHWKHNDNDRESRKKWDDYRKVYHKIFKDCNTIPWHVVPSDKNRWKVYQVANILVATFENMKLEWPELETDVFHENAERD